MQPVQMSNVPQSKEAIAAIDVKKRKEAVRGFEEMFVGQMLKAMRQTVPEGEESRAKVLWREQFDAEIAKRIADGKGIGLAPLLEKGIASTGAGTGRKP
jgi:Rod binding domain-containing protein